MDSLIIILISIGGYFLISWLYWGFLTNFSFRREKESNDLLISEYYHIIKGWEVISIEQNTEKLKESITTTLKNPLLEHISKEVAEKGSWVAGTPFPKKVVEDYKEWKKSQQKL